MALRVSRWYFLHVVSQLVSQCVSSLFSYVHFMFKTVAIRYHSYTVHLCILQNFLQTPNTANDYDLDIVLICLILLSHFISQPRVSQCSVPLHSLPYSQILLHKYVILHDIVVEVSQLHPQCNSSTSGCTTDFFLQCLNYGTSIHIKGNQDSLASIVTRLQGGQSRVQIQNIQTSSGPNQSIQSLPEFFYQAVMQLRCGADC